MKNKKVYVVITVCSITAIDADMFGDVIGVYSTEKKAEDIVNKMRKRKKIEGLDYNNLVEFDDINYFERTLDETLTNSSDEEEAE